MSLVYKIGKGVIKEYTIDAIILIGVGRLNKIKERPPAEARSPPSERSVLDESNFPTRSITKGRSIKESEKYTNTIAKIKSDTCKLDNFLTENMKTNHPTKKTKAMFIVFNNLNSIIIKII